MIRTLRLSRIDLAAMSAAAGISLFGAAAHAQWGGNTYPVGNGGRSNAQLVFEWQGNVDRETQITIGRNSINVRGTQSNESRGRIVSRGAMPNGSGTLYIQRVDGRGNVDVIQQPGNNGYGDGVIRIRDSQGGADFYDVRVYWQPSGTYSNNGEVWGDRNGGYDRNDRNDRDRDGRYDRNDRSNRNGVALDRNGNPVRDRQGNVVYERRGNREVARDRNGNVIFDRNGHAVYEKENNGRRRR